MKYKIILSLVVAIATSGALASWENLPEDQAVLAAKKYDYSNPSIEFITALNFLRENESFSLKSSDQQQVAQSVAAGGQLSAQRFIGVIKLLTSATLPTAKAIEVGVLYAKLSDAHYQAFTVIFKEVFLGEVLDLSAIDALNLAIDLSKNTPALYQGTQSDFAKIVKFCLAKDSVQLPARDCAQLASHITIQGQEHQTALGQDFLDLFKFLTERDGPNLPSYQAIEIAKKVISFGPLARESFATAYQFASSKKGLDLDIGKSISFSVNLAGLALKKKENPREQK